MEKWRDPNRDARTLAGAAKRRGELVPEPCRSCGAANVEMHHEDYAKPLDVQWLCRSCHLKVHDKEARSKARKLGKHRRNMLHRLALKQPRQTWACY